MPTKCMVQTPQPMAAAPRASHPALKVCPPCSERTVQRSPRAPPSAAIRKAATGVTRP